MYVANIQSHSQSPILNRFYSMNNGKGRQFVCAFKDSIFIVVRFVTFMQVLEITLRAICCGPRGVVRME